MKFAVVCVVAAMGVCSAQAAEKAVQMKAGLWEVRSSSNVSGQEQLVVQQSCVKELSSELFKEGFKQSHKQAKCQAKETYGKDLWKATATCTVQTDEGKLNMVMSSEVTPVTTSMNLSGKSEKGVQILTNAMTGKWLSADCGELKVGESKELPNPK